MIISNGTLKKITIVGKDFDDFGVPLEAQRTIGDEIPCNISGSKQKFNENENAAYSTATYEVLIENESDFYADEVVLNKHGKLGTFRVQDIQYLDSVDAIKLICVRYAD